MADPENQPELSQHLSRIETLWTVLFDAHGSSVPTVTAAQERLLRRYSGAVYRYLFAVLRDANAADELAQEFALNFLRGSFKGAAPEKGRFRDYVKASLFNLIRGYHRQRQRHQGGIDVADAEPEAAGPAPGDDQAFVQGWRDEMLARSWAALLEYETETGRLYHTMLKYRASNPDTRAAEMAEIFTRKLGKTFTQANVRQLIHRAREKFGDLLIDEVAQSLQSADLELIEQELIDLGLHSYCGDALQRRAESGQH